jgi:hypothetical protein
MLERRFAYRLTQWPELPDTERSVHLLRAFSRMSVGPVTAAWFLANSRLDAAGATRLLQRLTSSGVVERIDFGA